VWIGSGAMKDIVLLMKRWIVNVVMWCFGRLPVWLVTALGRFLAMVLRLLRFRRRDIDCHLQWAFPELDVFGRRQLYRQIYQHFGLLLAEALRLPKMSQVELLDRCRFHNVGIPGGLLKEGKGIFILAAHVGNWELGLAALAEAGYSAHVVAKEIKGEMGQHFVTAMRGNHGIQTILRNDQAGRKIVSAIRTGNALGFVLDQNMTSDEGIFVDFFGRPACTMTGLAILSQRTKAPVIPIRFERDPDGYHHDVWIMPPIPWEDVPGEREEVIRHNTQRYTRVVEEMIRLCPAQWLWMHRRWRTRPQ
jgi:KDO2-lipid IV(A) lauroyltransferase